MSCGHVKINIMVGIVQLIARKMQQSKQVLILAILFLAANLMLGRESGHVDTWGQGLGLAR